MAFEIWDVVACEFPNQEDNTKSTYRPAIFIEDLDTQAFIAPITKQLHQERIYNYTIKVLKDSTEGIQMGLTFDSLIVIDRVDILSKSILKPTNCNCPKNIVDKIKELINKKNDDERK